MTDHLDRLFRILVLRVRDVRPEHLSRPFEVGEILRTFTPYRTSRAEVGVEAAEDFEVLVMRLLSGERGLMFADDAMQDDLRRELDSGNPDLRALHAYGTAKVQFAQHAMRQVLESAAAPAAPAAPGEATTGAAVRSGDDHAAGAAPAERASSDAAAARVPSSSEVAAAFDSLQRQLPPTLAELGEAMGAVGDGRQHAMYQPRGSRIPDPTAESATRTPRPGCRFCGQMLPEGREVTFCPHCGQNLRVRRCPGCSAEMDPAWKFCVVCGRAAATN